MSCSSIKILFFADTHLGFDYPIRPRLDRCRRGFDFFDNYRRVLEFAASAKIDVIVHGGDLFFRSKVPAQVRRLAYLPMLEIAEKIPVLAIPGNHERSHFPDKLVLEHPNIFIFDKPRTYILDLKNTRIAFAGFPFIRHNIRARFPGILAQTSWDQAEVPFRLLCLHQAVDGAQVGPSDFTFRNGPEVIDMETIPAAFAAVLAGHIHRHQVLGRRRNRLVIYPGSIERTSVAEKDEPKGFCVVTIKNGTGNRDPVQVHFQKLPVRPMYSLSIDGSARSRQEVLTLIKAKIEGLDPEGIVRIKITNCDRAGAALFPSAGDLRALVPDSMHVSLSPSIFRVRRRKVKTLTMFGYQKES